MTREQAEKAGADGILLMPHYLTEAGQEGLAAHVERNVVIHNAQIPVIAGVGQL